MIKKISVIFFSIFAIFSFFSFQNNIQAKTLAEMKEELNKDKINMNTQEQRKKEAQAKLKKYDSEIDQAGEKIEEHNNEIEAAQAEIEELGIEITKKYAEIDELMKFLQVSNGENVYLEYVFGATSFTDFIYRTSIVEQLSKHNDELIVEMNELIEKDKKLQEELKEKIKEEEKAIDELEKLIKSIGLSIDDISEHQQDLKAEIKAAEEEIAYYEAIGCKLNEDISECIDVPYAIGFTRPMVKGYISSNFGWRILWGKKNYHSGMDIAVNSGSKVYASAAGYVSGKVNKSSCGGNILYIKHNIGGVKYTTAYMHLNSFKVNVGDTVTINTVIGLSGGGSNTYYYDKCTGGSHLHFGIYKGWGSGKTAVNPRNYISFPSKGSSYYSRW